MFLHNKFVLSQTFSLSVPTWTIRMYQTSKHYNFANTQQQFPENHRQLNFSESKWGFQQSFLTISCQIMKATLIIFAVIIIFSLVTLIKNLWSSDLIQVLVEFYFQIFCLAFSEGKICRSRKFISPVSIKDCTLRVPNKSTILFLYEQ